MFWVGLGEIAVTVVGVIFVYWTLTETRRIGEPQVRAYLNVAAVLIKFMDGWVPGDAAPRVGIVVKNTGQSPARNFVWQPTLQYFSGSARRQRELGGNWADMLGVSISAGDTHQDNAMVSDMLIGRFSSTANNPLHEVMVRVKIDFAYTDVFGKRFTEEAFFAGFATTFKTADGIAWHDITPGPMPALRDWDDSTNFQNQ